MNSASDDTLAISFCGMLLLSSNQQASHDYYSCRLCYKFDVTCAIKNEYCWGISHTPITIKAELFLKAN